MCLINVCSIVYVQQWRNWLHHTQALSTQTVLVGWVSCYCLFIGCVDNNKIQNIIIVIVSTRQTYWYLFSVLAVYFKYEMLVCVYHEECFRNQHKIVMFCMKNDLLILTRQWMPAFFFDHQRQKAWKFGPQTSKVNVTLWIYWKRCEAWLLAVLNECLLTLQ